MLLLSVTVSVCPACAVVVPLMVIPAPASLTLRISSLAMVLMVTSGAVASTLYARSAWALLPLILLTLACTLPAPSGSAARSAGGTFTVQLPLASTVVV